jgi:hypothetical protein
MQQEVGLATVLKRIAILLGFWLVTISMTS